MRKTNLGGQSDHKRLLGKRVLVTAAGQGIGRASALAMADQGAQVFATDVNEAALATLAEGSAGKIGVIVKSGV